MIGLALECAMRGDIGLRRCNEDAVFGSRRSDGLTDVVGDDEIARIVARPPPPVAANALVEDALAAGAATTCRSSSPTWSPARDLPTAGARPCDPAVTAPGVDLGPIRRNLELKATDPDPRRSLATCRALGAVDHGVLSQRDTYFAAPHGRLKLREESPGSPQLIHYERSDEPRARPSHYRIAPVADPETLCAILAAALGIRGVVVKRRRLLLWHDVRIHLDEVDGCGAFLELEAVAAPESDFGLERRRIAALREALDLGDDRLLAGGYIDASGDADALDDAPRQPLY